jgi:hypothetical protein
MGDGGAGTRLTAPTLTPHGHTRPWAGRELDAYRHALLAGVQVLVGLTIGEAGAGQAFYLPYYWTSFASSERQESLPFVRPEASSDSHPLDLIEAHLIGAPIVELRRAG